MPSLVGSEMCIRDRAPAVGSPEASGHPRPARDRPRTTPTARPASGRPAWTSSRRPPLQHASYRTPVRTTTDPAAYALAAIDNFYRSIGVGRPEVAREELARVAPRALAKADQRRFLRAVEGLSLIHISEPTR